MNLLLEKSRDEELELASKGGLDRQAPGLYEVIIHNDDFTPMAFVIEALQKFFHLDPPEAKKITLDAHTKGRAVCGTYSRDLAETRIDQASEHAKMHDHPLRWSMEAASF